MAVVKFKDNPPRWTQALRGGLDAVQTAARRSCSGSRVSKVLYALGFTKFGGPPVLLGSFPAFLVLFAAAGWLRRVPGHLMLATGAFIVSHLAAVVIAYPWSVQLQDHPSRSIPDVVLRHASLTRRTTADVGAGIMTLPGTQRHDELATENVPRQLRA